MRNLESGKENVKKLFLRIAQNIIVPGREIRNLESGKENVKKIATRMKQRGKKNTHSKYQERIRI